ncbi:MAG: thioredoxin [Salinivirgaceae bacterium]|nr:MAG: thioredoxin [Salinivirgaceae bacterium]
MIIRYYSTPQCNICKSLKPKVIELAKKYNITFEYVDLNENEELKGQLLLFSVPAVIFFDEDREMKRFVRTFGIIELEDFIQRVM